MRRTASSDTVMNKPPPPDGLSSGELDGLIRACFVQPQAVLSNRDKTNNVRLDNVTVIAVRLETDAPSSRSTMLNDPVTIKLGVQTGTDLDKTDDSKLVTALSELKKRDSAIGGWTFIYDVKREANEPQRPTWRLAAEVRPSSVTKIAWCQMENGKRVLCLDVEGVGVFIGRQKKA